MVSENLSCEPVAFSCAIGHRVRRTGVIFCQVRNRELAKAISGNHDYWRLDGTTIILCSCGQFVITVYRNPAAFKKDRSKSKYNSKQWLYCPCCGKRRSAAA